MEMEKKMEANSLINELIHGKEQANQLRNQLRDSSSHQKERILITKILDSFEKTLSMLNSSGSGFPDDETKYTTDLSRRSQSSDLEPKNVLKKRKTSEGVSEKAKVRIAIKKEGSHDDGYCWRKYGQKHILNSKYPRGYYRCTHRFSQECLATKQVQRSDTDPSIFDVTYVGSHTCNSVSTSVDSSPTTSTITVCSDEKKPRKSDETFLSSDELDQKKEIFQTFWFPDFQFENDEERNDYVFAESKITGNLSPRTPTSPIGDFDISLQDITDLDINFSLEGCLEPLS